MAGEHPYLSRIAAISPCLTNFTEAATSVLWTMSAMLDIFTIAAGHDFEQKPNV